MKTNRIWMGAISVGVLFIGVVWFFKTQVTQASTSPLTPRVSLIQAVETVLGANPGTVAVDVNLEQENNVLAWEVELSNDLEVYIDANTGAIIHTEQGWDIADFPLLQDWLPN